MVPEAALEKVEGGLVPDGPGWFVLNAKEARWLDGHFGAYTRFEGEERKLKAWDFFHCPAWTEHVFVGSGEGPCAILAIGSRSGEGVIYPASELAQRHGAGVKVETRDPKESYVGIREDADVGYREGWLPGG